MAKKKPDVSKLRTERRPRSEKYFDTTKYPIFKGTNSEYLDLVKKYVKTKQMTTEEFAIEFGTLRKPLDPKKYPNMDITPEMIEEGDLFTSRKSKPTQSAYETSNTKNHRAKSMEMQSITTDSSGEYEYHTFQDGVKSNEDELGQGRALHHRRGINQYRPFFEGLNQDETIELSNWFRQEGYTVGNHLDNLVALTENAKDAEKYNLPTTPILHQGEGSIHNWQSKVNVEPQSTTKLYKDIVGEMTGKSVSERLPIIIKYLEEVQDPIESKLGSVGSYAKQRDFQQSLGTIPSGPRKGQPLPVNRRTIGDAIIRDLRLENGSIKVGTKGLIGRGLARAALPSVIGGAASLALGAGDVQAREERAQQDPSFINKFQAGLARTEQAADVAGMVPGPQTTVAEPVGFGAGLTNVAIDVARDPMGTLKAVGGGLKYLANEYVLRGAMTAP
jgi:hypothetical protein